MNIEGNVLSNSLLTHWCQKKTHADTLWDSSRGGFVFDDSRYLAHDVTFLNSNSHDHIVICYSFAEVWCMDKYQVIEDLWIMIYDGDLVTLKWFIWRGFAAGIFVGFCGSCFAGVVLRELFCGSCVAGVVLRELICRSWFAGVVFAWVVLREQMCVFHVLSCICLCLCH